MAWTKEQTRAYQAAWREKNRDKTRERQKEWWRKKHGSVPRAEYLAAVKAETARKKAEQAEQRKRDREQRKAAKQIAPVIPPPKPALKPAPRAVVRVRKPGRLLAMAGFVRNW